MEQKLIEYIEVLGAVLFAPIKIMPATIIIPPTKLPRGSRNKMMDSSIAVKGIMPEKLAVNAPTF